MSVKEILNESYCRTIRSYLEDDPGVRTGRSSADKREMELYSKLEHYIVDKKRIMQDWADTPLEELDGITPSEVIKNMEEFKDVFDLFIYMVENADDEIPDIIIGKLGTFEKEAVPALAALADTCLVEHDSGNKFTEAVSSLGKLKSTGAVHALIDLAYKANNNDVYLDHIEEALRNAGPCTIEPILEVLEGKEIGKAEEMLLYVLAFTGASQRDDRIYKMLRMAFRTMENKLPAVICLNVYGDGRAIPMLKGYLERNRKIEKNLFFEIIGTIRNLGGITEEFVGY